jgi:hypothetical protein
MQASATLKTEARLPAGVSRVGKKQAAQSRHYRCKFNGHTPE